MFLIKLLLPFKLDHLAFFACKSSKSDFAHTATIFSPHCVYPNFSFTRRLKLSVRMTARLCRPRTESFQELVFLGGEGRPNFEFLRRRQDALKTVRVERDKGFKIARDGGGNVQSLSLIHISEP